MSARVRPARPADMPRLWEMLLGLAEYEKLTDAVTGNAGVLARDLFGDHPCVECLVLDEDGRLQGYALFYTTYSSFRTARCWWLEDLYVDPTGAELQRWIAADLAGTDARWKFVTFHQPCFNVGAHHAHEQQMRVLAPIFERHGVNFVLSGHEHNYQRTQPLRFAPRDLAKAAALNSKDRVVTGDFTIDRAFDGETHTRADGVIYITTGAGGKYLYDQEFNDDPAKWSLPEDNHERYVTRMISDRHSLTVFDVERDELLLRQIDEHGNEIDRIRVTA